jgi:glucose-6-phosphate 1-dehydrogenase
VTLVAMEAPVSLSSEDVRDEKVKVLRAIRPLSLDDVILGQYEGYTFDPEVPDGSKTETFAQATMWVDNARWSGVPFVVKCGKAVNERKCEIRIQFEESPLPYHQGANRNELVLRVQPDEAMYLKTNMKKVGQQGMVTAELDLSYNKRFPVSSQAVSRCVCSP